MKPNLFKKRVVQMLGGVSVALTFIMWNNSNTDIATVGHQLRHFIIRNLAHYAVQPN